MSTDTLCRVCLVDDMNLHIVRNDLKRVYERIAKEKYNKDGYPIHLCYICLAVLQKCHRFMETAQKTNIVLKQWYNEQKEMSAARPLYTYSSSKVDEVSISNGNISLENETKMEEEDSEIDEVQLDTPPVKKRKTKKTKAQHPAPGTPDETDANSETSDDDITFLNSPPSEPDNITLDTNNGSRKTTAKSTNVSSKKRRVRNVSDCNETPHNTSVAENNGTMTCNYKTKVTQHSKISQTDSKPFQCDICDLKFTQKFNQTRHMRAHTGEKPFWCAMCDYKTSRKSDLVTHLRRHTGGKPFACYLCDYKCPVKYDLSRHMKTHTGEKPYSCHKCPYKCSQHSQLKRHLLGIHSISKKPYH